MKKTFLFIFCFVCLQSFAPKELSLKLTGSKEVPCMVYMEDGTTKAGLVDFPLKTGAKSITLKISGIKEKIELEGVTKLEFRFNLYSVTTYYNMAVYNFNGKKIQKNKQMLQMALQGAKVSLYTGTYDWSGFANSGGGFQSFSYSGTSYYAIRPGEPAATLLHEDFGVNKNADFKLYASRYFADYPELVEKIKNKELMYDKIYEAIIAYNNH
jgi:hypothetical protein